MSRVIHLPGGATRTTHPTEFVVQRKRRSPSLIEARGLWADEVAVPTFDMAIEERRRCIEDDPERKFRIVRRITSVDESVMSEERA